MYKAIPAMIVRRGPVLVTYWRVAFGNLVELPGLYCPRHKAELVAADKNKKLLLAIVNFSCRIPANG